MAQTTKLNYDEKAPYAGVLIGESSFRSMWTNINEANGLKSELQSCLDNHEEIETFSKPTVFSFGMVVGMFITALLVKSVR